MPDHSTEMHVLNLSVLSNEMSLAEYQRRMLALQAKTGNFQHAVMANPKAWSELVEEAHILNKPRARYYGSEGERSTSLSGCIRNAH